MLLILFPLCLAAGLIQTLTGFGSGVVIMLVLPLLVPLIEASTISNSITLFLCTSLAWQYRKNINLKLILFPLIVFYAVSGVILKMIPSMNSSMLEPYFGLFLMGLSIYFFVYSEKIKIKANQVTAGICATLSGVVSALFGVAGPPMVIYFLYATSNKEEYQGTIQFYFFLTCLYTFVMRIYNGLLNQNMIIPIIVGIVAITIGQLLGNKLIKQIDTMRIKKIIYCFLAFSGAGIILKSLIG